MPFPTEQDLALLEELLEDADDAGATYRILSSCPPEVAAVAALVIHSSQKISRILDRILSLLEQNQSQPPEVDDEPR